jgi:hypothetical protein
MQGYWKQGERLRGLRMRTDDELTQVAIAFIGDCKIAQSVFEFSAELANIGAYGAKVPKANAHTWKRTIEAALAKGLLVDDGNAVRIPYVENGKDVQMLLF